MGKDYQLGDGPIEDQYHALMNGLARALDETFNEGCLAGERHTGFVLLAFPFGDVGSRVNFISNGAGRTDLVCLFKEMIARFEGQPEMKGNA